jgi:hypothetical protein
MKAPPDEGTTTQLCGRCVALSLPQPQERSEHQILTRTQRKCGLVVNFQEVVHSVLTGNADVARQSDSRRTEWTPIRMPA